METIKAIIAQGYSLLNVSPEKRPFIKAWNTKTREELKATHDYKSTLWGIKLGRHENNRRLLCFDFDIYGSEHPETPCPIAKAFFEEYMADVGEEGADGMFYGSTVGNAGLLVDITDNETMCAGVDMLISAGKSKGKIGEMEVFWGDKELIVLPPSATVCKRAKKIVQARKLINDNWICRLDNSKPEESCMVLWMCEKIKTLIEKNQPALLTPPNSRTGTPPPNITEDKWTDLLLKYIGNPRTAEGGHKISRGDFIAICGALKYNGYNPAVWRKWVALDARNGDGMKTWDSLKIDRPSSIFVLKRIARQINPEEFARWKRDYKIFLPHKTLMEGENDIAKFLEFHLSPYLRCFKKVWWLYDERTCLWSQTDTPTSYIITTLQQLIDDATGTFGALKQQEEDQTKKDELQKTIDSYLEYRRKCCSSSIYNALQTFLKTYLACDKEWCERFDNNPYKIPYKDGVLCLKTNTFRAGLLPTDYLTHTIPYNYEAPNEEVMAWLEEELLKICNYKKPHLERYLSQLGYMLCGDPSRVQEFYNFKGEKAGNGKSSILDALTEILPNLVKKLNADTFEKSAKATLHKTIATLLGVRIAWLNEIDASALQDEGTLKTYTDGMTISYNAMYGVNMSMKITGKLVVVGNNGMKVKGDNGIMRRMVINQFDSEFTDEATENDYENCVFVRDTEFPKKLVEKKHSLLGLIYKYSKKFWDDGELVPMPKEWLSEKEEMREDLAKFDKWFDTHYEWAVGHNGWTASIDDIEAHAKLDKMKNDNIKCELKRMKLWNNPIKYNSQERIQGKKGWFVNLHRRDTGGSAEE